MELLEVELPKNIIIGNGALDKIGNVCQELGLKGSVGFFTGPDIMKIISRRVLDILESHDYNLNVKIPATEALGKVLKMATGINILQGG